MFQRVIQFLANGLLQKLFFAEFKKRAHRCGTDAITTTSLADRRALSHTTCTVELLYYILLVFLKCANTHKSAEHGSVLYMTRKMLLVL